MHQVSQIHTKKAVTRNPGGIGTGLPQETRLALRALGNVALRLADGEPLDAGWISGQLGRIGQVERSPETADLLTVTEAHTRLRISKSGFYNLIHQRALTTVKIGTRRFVPRSEIDRFLGQLIQVGGRP